MDPNEIDGSPQIPESPHMENISGSEETKSVSFSEAIGQASLKELPLEDIQDKALSPTISQQKSWNDSIDNLDRDLTELYTIDFPNLQSWISENHQANCSKNIESALSFEKIYQEGMDFFEKPLSFLIDQVDQTTSNLSYIYPNITPLETLMLPLKIGERSIKYKNYAIVTLRLIFELTLLKAAKTTLKDLEYHLKEGKDKSHALEKQVEDLKLWIKKIQKKIQEDQETFLKNTLTRGPGIICLIAEMANHSSKALKIGAFGAGAGFSLLFSGYSIYKSEKKIKKYRDWEGRLRELSDFPCTEEKRKKIQSHLEEQKTQVQKNKADKLEKITVQLQDLLQREIDLAGTLETVGIPKGEAKNLERFLETRGFPPIKSKQDLNDSKIQYAIAEYLIQTEQNINIGIKRSLQRLIQFKQKASRALFIQKRKDAQMGFLITLGYITLTSLKIAGVVAGIAACASGFGLMGVSLCLMGLGVYYAYKKMPNTFKAKCTLAYQSYKLREFSINLQKWRQKRLEIKSLEHKVKSAMKIHDISHKKELILGIIKLQESFATLHQEDARAEKIDEKIDAIKKDIEAKMEELKHLKFHIDKENFNAKKTLKELDEKLSSSQEKSLKEHIKILMKIQDLGKSIEDSLEKQKSYKDILLKASQSDHQLILQRLHPDLRDSTNFLSHLITEEILENRIDPETKDFVKKELGIEIPDVKEKADLYKKVHKHLTHFVTLDEHGILDLLTQQEENHGYT